MRSFLVSIIFLSFVYRTSAQEKPQTAWTCAQECVFKRTFGFDGNISTSDQVGSFLNNSLTRRIKRHVNAATIDALKKFKELKDSLKYFCDKENQQWNECFNKCPASNYRDEFLGKIEDFKKRVCGDIDAAMDKLACIASSAPFKRCVGENCAQIYLDLGKTIMRYMLDEKRAIPGDKVCKVDDCVGQCASNELVDNCGEEGYLIFEDSNRIEHLVMVLLMFKEEPKLDKGRYCGDIPI